MLEKVSLRNFTVFESLDIAFSPGVNIFIGENGTGKTHLLKLLYAPLAALSKDEGGKADRISDKLVNVFLPKDKLLSRLIRRPPKGRETVVEILRSGQNLRLRFSPRATDTLKWNKAWKDESILPPVYIPVKEMLANAPHFLSTYDLYNIHFEEVYADILRKAFLPAMRDSDENGSKGLQAILEKAIDGKVITKEEQFYLKNKQGELEFTLLAEGMRKLGLLWLLIRNGALQKGATLFWDEPEANLNPKLVTVIVTVFLELQRRGIQIFIATHSYALLKEFDLQRNNHDLMYYTLYRDEENRVSCNTSEDYKRLHPNAISEHSDRIFALEVERKFGSGR